MGQPKGLSWKLQFTLGGGQGWVGPPSPSTQLKWKRLCFIYDPDLAELRPGGWEKLAGEREKQKI